KSSPMILETVMDVDIIFPDEYMGDVIGVLNGRRGIIGKMDSDDQGSVVTAKVPLSEMFGYTTDLRSITQGRATSSMEFSEYAAVPSNLEKEIIESRA